MTNEPRERIPLAKSSDIAKTGITVPRALSCGSRWFDIGGRPTASAPVINWQIDRGRLNGQSPCVPLARPRPSRGLELSG
jgi:hypothetical protein